MTTKILLTLVLVAAATSAGFISAATSSLAQSQPNYGPNSPAGGDTYGEPYSGSAGARRRSGGY